MKNETIEDETKRMMKLFRKLADFYKTPDDGKKVWDITPDVLRSPYVEVAQKQAIIGFNRRIFVFIYPSDGLEIKGVISFIPDPVKSPTIVLLRGGNRIFGIPNPGSDFFCFEKYTVISTLYRGGLSEGIDEYGGDDVNDVKNLVDFFPLLESWLNIFFQNEKMFLLGCSRGGMQLFLALARFPSLQKYFKKAVSLSGLLDIQHCITSRSDMREMFATDFGLLQVDEKSWIDRRDPLKMVDKIDPMLPFLIIQGTDDARVDLIEGYHMIEGLFKNCCDATYWEIEGGTHCLHNVKERMQAICEWLED